ncbi:hypothetical protein V6N13_127948 [Hibiscus sabdariffa]|uniref:Uncharacterized protein n=1 Tax=Hibiscus sabdariffa TaxID=183260 RepID=A0ABR2CEM5_9ROSI
MGSNQLSLAFVVTMMILLKLISGSDAVLILESNTTTYRCNGLLDDCRVGDELQSELDFLMQESTVIRILQFTNDGHPSIEALTADKPVQNSCEVHKNCPAKGGKPKCKNIFACRGILP